jgi:hypothetical protein
MAVHDATVTPDPAKKFHVFHQRDFRKPANVSEDSSPAEYPVVATSHSQRNPGVVRKTIGQSVYQVLRQANSKEPASDYRIVHNTLDLSQTSRRNFRIHMEKPKNVAVGSACTGVHLYPPIWLANNNLITKTAREISSAVEACPICDNDLSFRGSFAQVLQKWTYQGRLIKDWDNDREVHSELRKSGL